MSSTSAKKTSIPRLLFPIALVAIVALGFPLKSRSQSRDEPEKAIGENPPPATSPFGSGATSGGIATRRDSPEQPLQGLSQPPSPEGQTEQSAGDDQGDEQQGEYYSDQDDE